MTLGFCIGFTVMAGLGIICLTASIAALIKAQEVLQSCLRIFDRTYDWLEQIHGEQEVKAHECTE